MYDNLHYEHFNRFNAMQDRDERICGWQFYTRLNFVFSSMESGALRHYAQLSHSLKERCTTLNSTKNSGREP